MSKTSQPETLALEEQAVTIANEIFNLTNQYTHDSNISKFFLTDEIAKTCYGLSGGLASVIYTPALEPEETKDTTILSFIYALMTYGFNLYLKERSLLTNASPYTLPNNRVIIKRAQKKTVTMTYKGKLSSTLLADKIIEIISDNVKSQMNIKEFNLKDHKLQKDKLLDYTKLTMYWGYNFAKELLSQEKQKTIKK